VYEFSSGKRGLKRGILLFKGGGSPRLRKKLQRFLGQQKIPHILNAPTPWKLDSNRKRQTKNTEKCRVGGGKRRNCDLSH